MAKSKSTPPTSLPARPPVVTIMGHVDHGKTTLLDHIRQTKVQASEAGGITQHIGAYQITHNQKLITFIDTPGHAAFTKMRARGASVTDIVVLVIAANDGVKPQTVESINHIKAAKVPLIVAINKIDLPQVNPDLIKSQLVKYDINVEGYGGQVLVVAISAKTGKNVNELLDTILLVAEMEELTADPQGQLQAFVIESNLDPRRGPVATLIVKSGTIKVGQTIYLPDQMAKVKRLADAAGKTLTSAGPGTPVEVLGFKTKAPIGSLVSTSADLAKAIPELASVKIKPRVIPPDETKTKSKTKEKPAEELSLEELSELSQDQPEDRPHIKIILKSDTTGTLEAIKGSFTEEIDLIGEGIGEINESDVMLADNTQAVIIGFNVNVSKQAQRLAATQKVTIKTYKVIYKLLEDLEKQILKLMEPTIDEEQLGTAQIIAVFDIKNEKIAGCKVKTGKITKTSLLHLTREDEIIADTKIKSLKREKTDVDEVKAGVECGFVFADKIDFKIGDVIIAYRKIIE